MARGGKRPGAGAKKGVKFAKTLVKEAARQKHLEEQALTAARVIEEIRRLAMIDVRSFFKDDGSCKSFSELTPEQGACIAGFEVLIKNAKAGDGVTDTIHKFRLWDKTRALEMLAKHFALLTENIKISGQVDVVSVLRKRFERAKHEQS